MNRLRASNASISFDTLTALWALLTASVVCVTVAAPTGGPHLGGLRTIFLAIAAAILGSILIPLRAGRISLLAIPIQTGALLGSPFEAAVIGVMGNIPMSLGLVSGGAIWRTARIRLYLASAFWGSIASAVHDLALTNSFPSALGTTITLLAATLLNVAVAALHVATYTQSSVVRVLRTTVDPTFVAAYAYFAIASSLAAFLLDGSASGFLHALLLFLLTTALAWGIREQVTRDSLRQQIATAEDRIAFGESVEAVLHQLKNLLGAAAGFLDEARDSGDVSHHDRSLSVAASCLHDATALIRRVSTEGRLAYTPRFEDDNLSRLVLQVLLLSSANARKRGVRIDRVLESATVPVYVDCLLIREALANLINNALEALGSGGHIIVTVGVRGEGVPFVEVVDNGPGLPSGIRDRVFGIRRTTKDGAGAGLGLIASETIARQHLGELTCASSPNGSTFTLILPPADVAKRRLAP